MPPANRVRVANSLLATLPVRQYRNLLTGIEPVTLTFGEVLYQPGELIQYTYFPNDCLVSLLAVVEGRTVLEVGLVGSEGMVGIPLALGVGISLVRALVQRTGAAMRMKSARFLQEFRRNPSLRRELFRYTHASMAQATQIAVCSRFHFLESRLARSLLMTCDRVQSNEFRLTHEFLAYTLGVRRVGITKAAGALQQRKLISYRRGGIRILDRKGLEAASCRCYRIVKNAHDGVQCGNSNRKNLAIAATA